MTDERFATAERLGIITNRIGFALWQLQELEGVAANCFVLLAQATPGMGQTAAAPLVEAALAKTFGQTCAVMERAKLLEPALYDDLRKVLAERNWLVHRSRSTSRAAVHNDEALEQLVCRIDAIADSVDSLMGQLLVIAGAHVGRHGVSKDVIERYAATLLAQWHAED